jgi:hypothetical protein
MKFRKKPVVIDAIHYTGDNLEAIAVFMNRVVSSGDGMLRIETLEGVHLASPGDWVIRGVKGEYYPCKPDIFAMTYEPAE